MFESYGFPEWQSHNFEDFGVFHLTVDDAAELVIKILFLEGYLEISMPKKYEDADFDLHSDDLTKILKNHIDEYKSLITNGIDKGTLKTAFILRKSNEEIITNATILKTPVLAD